MAKVSINERFKGYTDRFAFDFIDLQRTGFLSTIGAANQKVVGKMLPGSIIKDVTFYQVVDPAGASDLTLDVGTTAADPDEFINALDVDGMTQVAYNTGDAFIGTDSGAATTSNVLNGVANNTASSVDILMEFNGTLASLTAGSWILCWNQLDVPVS